MFGHRSTLIGGAERFGLAQEEPSIAMLEIEDRVQRPVEVVGEPGRLR
jgi:hypothetical protein